MYYKKNASKATSQFFMVIILDASCKISHSIYVVPIQMATNRLCLMLLKMKHLYGNETKTKVTFETELALVHHSFSYHVASCGLQCGCAKTLVSPLHPLLVQLGKHCRSESDPGLILASAAPLGLCVEQATLAFGPLLISMSFKLGPLRTFKPRNLSLC